MTDENFNSTFLATGSLLKKSIDVKSTSDRIIKGYCSIPVVDLENEIISTSAYNSAIKTVKDRTQKGRSIPIFIEHRRSRC